VISPSSDTSEDFYGTLDKLGCGLLAAENAEAPPAGITPVPRSLLEVLILLPILPARYTPPTLNMKSHSQQGM
jgi:hypothetical protein